MAINRDNYITVQGWMVTDLKLKGTGLLVYAIIYGFSQEENQRFTGSRQYLADWTNSTKRCVEKTLAALTDAGLLDKKVSIVNGVKFCSYRANKVPKGSEESSPGVANEVPRGGEESSPEVANKVPKGSEDSSPNNINNNLPDNLSNNSNKDNVPDEPAPRSSFKKPTLEEIAAYCEERQRTKGTQQRKRVDPEHFFDYYQSNGWKVGKNPMKDWKAAVRSWERNAYGSGTTQRNTPQQGGNIFLDMANERRGGL